MSEPKRPSTNDPSTASKSDRSIARLHLWQIQPVRDVAVILLILWLIGLGYRMSIVTVPLLLGLLLAYLLEPPIAWLARRTSRPFAAGAAIAVVILAFVVPVGAGMVFAGSQGIRFLSSLDNDLERFVDKVERFLLYLERDEVKVVISEGGGIAIEPGDPEPGEEDETDTADDGTDDPGTDERAPGEGEEPVAPPGAGDSAREDSGGAEKDADDEPKPERKDEEKADADDAKPERTLVQRYASTMRKAIRENFGTLSQRVAEGSIGALSIGWGWLIFLGGAAFRYLFLTPFFFFFWSISLGSVQQFGAQLIPEKYRPRALVVIRKMDRAIAAFIRGRLTIGLILAVLYTIAYTVIGVPVPFIFGPVIGIASTVPYLPLLGWPATMLAMAIDQAGASDPYAWWWIILGPTIVYFAFQTLDDYVLTPAIQGKNVGLSTPVILFAVLGAGALAGVYGILIAIPIAACIKILITDVIFPRYKAWVQGKADDPLPIGGREEGTEGTP
jgi:predicted PurR-regulated permease PerM